MNTLTTIHTRIYNKLAALILDLATLEVGEAMKSLGDGAIMDLNLDVLYTADSHAVIALSHYYKHNGDMIADPDMEIRLFHNEHSAEALTYQDSLVYQRVYFDGRQDNPKLKKSLNAFLDTWLGNCLQQGHRLERKITVKSQ